ncbi:MAG TPA: polyhydroxyalkanoate synthesis regulator DNA-binding domain-containing protein [Candidatus Binatia bacterium]|nr:polyhydroxyalkanoate synthesis regulator DNA-binding domain-containing protein [Candidatus Binatia bacterium]
MGTEREIRRYTNRKLYDKQQSRYVTLDDIAAMVRLGEEVRVIDNETKEDLTAVTFAQIILEEEKRKTHLVSVPFLRKLIRSGEAAVQDLSDRASRAITELGGLTGTMSDKVREVVDEGGRAVEEAIEESRGFIDELLGLPQRRLESLREEARKQVDWIRQSPSLQREIERLEKSIHSIEVMLTRLRAGEDEESIRASQAAAENGHAAVSDEAVVAPDVDTTSGAADSTIEERRKAEG